MDFQPRWHSITEVKLYRVSTSIPFQWMLKALSVSPTSQAMIKMCHIVREEIEMDETMKNDGGEKAFSEITRHYTIVELNRNFSPPQSFLLSSSEISHVR